MAQLRPTYRALAERSGSWWSVRSPDLRGVFTQARRLDGVEDMVRDAIALFLDIAPDSFDVSVEPVLESETTALVEQARTSRLEADRASRVASEQLRQAVERLGAAGLTVRDIGTVLGLSHQRVAQVRGPAPHR